MKTFSVGLIFIFYFFTSGFWEKVAAEIYFEENSQVPLYFDDGSKYRGQFKDGAPHGRGIITFSDGSTYTGEFEDGEICGQGTMVFPDGSKYVGQFKEGMIHGQGSVTFSDGSNYQGQFVDNRYHGEGTWSSPFGITYAGQFREGKFDGQGTYTLPDGSRYVGMFKADHFHGGTWDRDQRSERRFESTLPALEKEGQEVGTKTLEGFIPSHAYQVVSANDTTSRGEKVVPDGDDPPGQMVSGSAFSVQVGAFVSRSNAERMVAVLREKGYVALILPMVDYYDRSWYAVRLGSYSSLGEARKEAATFSEMEKLSATVRPVDKL